MSMLKSFFAALGLAALVMTTSVITAQAAPTTGDGGVSITAYADCQAGWFCVWEHANGQGRMARFQVGTPNLRDFNLNDQVSSVWNRTSRIFCTYLDINYAGAGWRVSAGWQGNTDSYNRNDNISSLRAC